MICMNWKRDWSSVFFYRLLEKERHVGNERESKTVNTFTISHDSPSKISRYDSLYIVLHQWWLWWKFIRPNTCEYVLSWPHWDFFRHTRRYVIDFSFRTVRMNPGYPSQVCEIWVAVSTKNGSQGSSAVTMTIRKQTIVQLFFCLGSIHASSSKHFFHLRQCTSRPGYPSHKFAKSGSLWVPRTDPKTNLQLPWR